MDRTAPMEPEFSDDLYLRFRELVLARCGLYYPERKRADLLHGLGMAMNAGGYESLAALYAAAVLGGPAWNLLLAHLTIGETYFFRYRPQFDALRQQIIPEILQRRAGTRGLRVWSAGCATGEEPYSLAMIISDLLAAESPWNVNILATDINPHFLERAREALYGEWSFRETPDELRERFWMQEQNRWRLRPEIRRMVSFARLNLAEPGYPSIVNGTCAIDLLLCRNVTIYFDDITTRQVVERFFNTLAPGGWLIVGHSEPQAGVYHQFEVHNFPNTVVYRKPVDAPMFVFDTWRGDGPEPLGPTPEGPAGNTPGSVRLEAHRRPATGPLRSPEPKASTSRGTAPLRLPDAKPAITQDTSHDGHADKLDRPILSAAEIEALITAGRQCAHRGDWAGAETACEQALAHDSMCIEAIYLLAQIHEQRGALEMALAAYRRTIYLDRGFVLGLVGIGNIWRQIGRARDARRYYEAALNLLSQLSPAAPILGAEGATAGELAALIHQQLRPIP
jgi:chemotaxis protein methyltransferase CheR